MRATFKAGRKEAPVYGARKRDSAAKMQNGVPAGHKARTNFGPLAVIAATKSVRGAVPLAAPNVSTTSCHHGDHSRSHSTQRTPVTWDSQKVFALDS